MRGRDYVIPQDVVEVIPDVLRHRLVLTMTHWRRVLGLLQRLAELALGDLGQRGRAGAQIVVGVGQVGACSPITRPSCRGPASLLRMRALSTGASRRGLQPTSKSASQSSRPAMVELNSQLSRGPSPSAGAVLTAVQAGHAQAAEQVERRLHRFGVLQVAGDDADRSGAAP